MQILILKARVPGEHTSDLFATTVRVAGYTTKDGTTVAPHTATRHVSAPPPPSPQQDKLADLLHRMRAAAQAVHLPASVAAIDAALASPAPVQGATVASLDRLVRQEMADRAPPAPVPPAAPPEPPEQLSQLDATRASVDRLGHELDRRWHAAVSTAVAAARKKEPGRGADFGRHATTWTVRQEGWFQDALRDAVAAEEPSLRALLSRHDRVLAAADEQARKAGKNEPWHPAKPPTELRALMDDDQGPVRAGGNLTMRAAAAPRPKAALAALEAEEPRAEPTPPAVVQQAMPLAQALEDLVEGRARHPDLARMALIEALDSFVAQHGAPGSNESLAQWLAAPRLPAEPGETPEGHAGRVSAARHRLVRLLGAITADGSYHPSLGT